MTPGRETPDPVALLPVTLEPADDRREAVANLFQFYVHDFADFWETRRVELQEDGRFPPYPWLDAFWEDPQGEALLIRAGGALVGFVLIDRTAHSGQACDYSMAEFFVARHYRREGIGLTAALDVLGARPGLWEIAVARRNAPALTFWRGVAATAAPSGFGEADQADDRWNGPILRLEVPARRPASGG
jgi:predicted acetyltransferase